MAKNLIGCVHRQVNYISQGVNAIVLSSKRTNGLSKRLKMHLPHKAMDNANANTPQRAFANEPQVKESAITNTP